MSKKIRGSIVIVLLTSAILLGLAVAYGDSSSSVTGVGARFPTIVASVKLEGEALQVAACGHYAFVASQDSGGYAMLEIIEFRDPTHPQLIKSIKLGEGTPTGSIKGIPYGIMTEGKFVYVGVRDKEYAFDVSNPENPNPQDFDEILAGPRIMSSYELEGSSMRFENVVFRAKQGPRRDTLDTLDYRTRESITIPTPGNAGDVFVIDDLLFIADGPIQGLTVMRLSPAPGLLPILGRVSTNTPGSAQAVTVFGSLVLIADGMEGLSIIDFSPFPQTGRTGPISPGSLVGVVDTPGEAVDVAAAGNVALIADSHEGLQIISLPSVQYLKQAIDVAPRALNISPDTAGAITSYTVTFNINNIFKVEEDRITITFPPGTIIPPRLLGPEGELPPGSINFSLDGGAPVAIPQVDEVGNVLLGNALWNPTTQTINITLPVNVTAGQNVAIIFTPAAGITNPCRGTNYIIYVSTTQNPIPIPSVNTYEIKPGPSNAAQNVRVVAISPDTAGDVASCIVGFDTSATGTLAAGDLITVTFPPGTIIPLGLCAPLSVHIQVGNAAPILAPGSFVAVGAPRGPNITVPVPLTAAPIRCHTRVVLYFDAGVRITNPPRGTNFAVMVKTISDPVDAFSDPYEIKPDLQLLLKAKLELEEKMDEMVEEILERLENLEFPVLISGGLPPLSIEFCDGLTETTEEIGNRVIFRINGPPGHDWSLLQDVERDGGYFLGLEHGLSSHANTITSGELDEEGRAEFEYEVHEVLTLEQELYFQAISGTDQFQNDLQKSNVLTLRQT